MDAHRCHACETGPCPDVDTRCMMCRDACDDATSQRIPSAPCIGGGHDMRLCLDCTHDVADRLCP